MPGTVASPYWFSETFGFSEESFDKTREKFTFADGILESKAFEACINTAGILTLTRRLWVLVSGLGVTKRQFHVGPFELVSVEELRERLAGFDGSLGGLTFSNVCGNAQTLHRDAANEGAVFQVASQFNCLEMNEPGARPEDGVTRYYSDATQGPACAVSCPAGTVFRNYFVNGSGQGRGRQLDGLAEIGELVNNAKEKYWRMVNGYCLPTDSKSLARLGQRIKEDEKLSDEIRNRLRIGVHWDTEVANKEHRVCQVFCSALPVAYAKSTRSQDWEAFARLVLQGTFEATLAIAAILSAERQARVKVYLSAVGGWRLRESHPVDRGCHRTSPQDSRRCTAGRDVGPLQLSATGCIRRPGEGQKEDPAGAQEPWWGRWCNRHWFKRCNLGLRMSVSQFDDIYNYIYISICALVYTYLF
ncbi:unnamed protein product [Durusdinium trenchii]|uniref:Uncharacterized protein n=1 Tax=Durusdinium trenchii TaxID=1381693 RepID=A0ABP0M9F0_9DINO